jgi:hypothetical protein
MSAAYWRIALDSVIVHPSSMALGTLFFALAWTLYTFFLGSRRLRSGLVIPSIAQEICF